MAESTKTKVKRLIREPPELPEDVITDIFTRLPVKSLLRFRSVSKRFLTLIDGPHFIKRHLNRSLTTQSNHKLILGGPDRNPNPHLYKHRSPNPHLYSVDLDKLDQAQELDHPCGTKILGTVNGILCLHNDENDIVLWNLATRKYHKLPVPENELPFSSILYIVYGFGYDSVSDDYKLSRRVQFKGLDFETFTSEAKVYSLRSNSWLEIQDFSYYMFYEQWCGELACGALHWLVSCKTSNYDHLIAAFDLATNEYRIVDYPQFLKEEIMFVLSLEGRLCVLSQKFVSGVDPVDVWVMKDYGLKDSWSKLFTVSQPKVISLFVRSNPLAYSKDGTEIMLQQDRKRILWYSIKEGRLRKINLSGCPNNFHPVICVESLVPLSGKPGDDAKKNGEKSAKEKQIKGVKKRALINRIKDEAGFSFGSNEAS